MVPGMAQCGSEAMTLDLQRAVEDWVERGIAPDRIETEIRDVQSSDRRRALCPYPQMARTRGTGSSTVCAN